MSTSMAGVSPGNPPPANPLAGTDPPNSISALASEEVGRDDGCKHYAHRVFGGY